MPPFLIKYPEYTLKFLALPSVTSVTTFDLSVTENQTKNLFYYTINTFKNDMSGTSWLRDCLT